MICSQNVGTPFALAFHVVQRAKVALERDKQGNYHLKLWCFLFVLSQFDFCSPARPFCSTWMASCQGPNISLVIDCRARSGSESHKEIKKVLKRQEIALCTTDVTNFRSLLWLNLIRIRDGPLENIWGGREGGGGKGGSEVQKKYSRKGKLNEKNHARQLTLKNIHAMA